MKILSGLICVLSLIQPAKAAQGPQSFIYHGRAYSADGTTPISSAVDIIFDVLAPNGCLLYEEMQTGIDLSLTQGRISVSVGSPTGSAIRTSNDLGLAMSDVFSNGRVIPTSANCVSGYTGQNGDSRKLHVKISQAGVNSYVALTPDVPLLSVPSSLSSETLQGKKPTDFIQVEGNVKQSNLDILTGGSEASTLHNHDSVYVKKTDSPTFPAAQVSSVGTSGSSIINKDYLTTQVTSVNASISNTNNNITNLNNQVALLPTKAYVSGQITTATSTLATAQSVTDANTTLSNLNTTISSLPTKSYVDSSVAAVQSNVTTNANNISVLQQTINGAVANPAGSIIPFAGINCPTGYLKADGSSYPISSYQTLATSLLNGSTYIWGSADATHFYVPDLRGEFLRGVDGGGVRDPDAGGRTNYAGANVGGIVGSYEGDAFQGHQHQLVNTPNNSFYGGGGGYGFVLSGTYSGPNAVPYVGNPTNDGAHGNPRTASETRPINVAVLYCIKI